MLVKIILLAKVMAGKKTLEYYQIPNQKILSRTKAELRLHSEFLLPEENLLDIRLGKNTLRHQ